MRDSRYDALIIGGGFYGCTLALHLAQKGQKVAILEKSKHLLRGASHTNQARVHQGYHYPRALLTARRSRVNYARFVADYADCIDDQWTHYYAVARTGSKVTAQQFQTFCTRIAAPLTPAPAAIRQWFNPHLIEEVWRVTEAVFNAERLAERMRQALEKAGVPVYVETEALCAEFVSGEFIVHTQTPEQSDAIQAGQIYVCAYSQINQFLERSGLPAIALKQEVTEMALVQMPESFARAGVTVMCGPFFSFLPFPTRPGLHTLSHVRYTPHTFWNEGPGLPVRPASSVWPSTHFPYMVKDATRYLPALAQARYQDSLWEIKTVLPVSETDDSRPILFARNYQWPGLTCILGGKIDNVYDMLREVDLG